MIVRCEVWLASPRNPTPVIRYGLTAGQAMARTLRAVPAGRPIETVMVSRLGVSRGETGFEVQWAVVLALGATWQAPHVLWSMVHGRP